VAHRHNPLLTVAHGRNLDPQRRFAAEPRRVLEQVLKHAAQLPSVTLNLRELTHLKRRAGLIQPPAQILGRFSHELAEHDGLPAQIARPPRSDRALALRSSATAVALLAAARPIEIEDAFQPFDLLALFYLGVPLGETFAFERCRSPMRRTAAYEMLLSASPLAFVGTVGAPPGRWRSLRALLAPAYRTDVPTSIQSVSRTQAPPH
jgi:hypothetical protein